MNFNRILFFRMGRRTNIVCVRVCDKIKISKLVQMVNRKTCGKPDRRRCKRKYKTEQIK